MRFKTVLAIGLAGVLALLGLSLAFGHLLGYPVLLAVVDSGSMEPTLEAGDGFIAVPTALSGDVRVGDVVVFQAETVNGGRTTTHRVIDERPAGYLTRGDASPFSDQSTGEPPVTDGQIKATALTVNGAVVRIPYLGTAAESVGSVVGRVEAALSTFLGVRRLGTDQFALLLFGAGVVVFAAALVDTHSRRRRSRARTRRREQVFDPRYLLVGSAVVIVAGATVGMVGSAGTETIGIVSSEGGSTNPTIVPVGGSDSYDTRIHNGGFLPTVSYFQPRSSGIEIEPERLGLEAGSSANATVTLFAPDEIGYYTRSMTEYRYFAFLPAAVIDWAYRLHPWLPYVLVDALVVLVLVVGWVAVGATATARRSRPTRRRSTGRGDDR